LKYDQYSTKFKDIKINKDLFKRTLRNNTQLYYKNNKIDLLTKEVEKLNYMKPSKINKTISSQIMTLDIETFIHNGFHTPYCISLFFKIMKLNDYYKTFMLKNQNEDLFIQVFDYLFKKEFNQYIIYIHNSSSFDMIFLLKKMVNHPLVKKMKPIIKDNKFINLEVYFKIADKTYKVTFRDSYLLLPSSLDKLSKGFNIENKKGIFPYKFVNKDNLLYEGLVPDYTFFDKNKVTLEQYLIYKNNYINNNKLWNLLEETKTYCELDCKVLFDIITSFQSEIFEIFKIDINKTPTLPSLAFKIFKTHYLQENQIPKITGRLYKVLSQAYFGGHVDMYIPSNFDLNFKVSVKDKIISLFNKVYHYDVNSLYPTGMKYLNFPTGKITHFICRNNESLSLLNKKYKLGIFRVNIECPKDLIHPIIPIKIDHACVYPIGNWEGWYHSEELINAEKYGYKYEIIEGYLFESSSIFKDYIDKLYEIKKNSLPNTPHYMISKLLMNSLYGRFAMNPHLLNHQIVNETEINNNKSFEEKIDLGNNKYLMTYYNEVDNFNMNINIAIGLSVTAYARIIMSYFKNNLDLTGKLYYSDTDSIFCEKELPLSCIGKELGQMKLEHVLKSFIAIAPKVYGGIDLENNSFTKVKGLKNKISFQQLEQLLIKTDLKVPFTQEKWYKSLKDGTIEIKQVPYILTPTNNKRKLLFKEFILFTYHFNKFKIKVSMCNIETNIINLVF